MDNKKHHILFVICSLVGGGAEKVLVDVLNNFDYDNFEVDVCLVYNKGIYRDRLPSNVKQYNIFPFTSGLFFRIIKLLYKLHLKKLYSWYINRRIPGFYDVGIAFLEGMATQCLSLKRNVGSKVAWVHSDLNNCHWTKDDFSCEVEENEVYCSMDKIVFVSDNAKVEFNKRFTGINSESQHVIYDPIDKVQIVKKSVELNIPTEKFTICTVGRLSVQKGYDRLIKVCHRLLRENFDFELWIVGEGDEKERLEKLSTDLGMNKYIRFIGFVTNPYPYIHSADLYVSSSIAEGFSLVVAEALCLSKPVISTLTAGPRELLKDGEYGLLVDNSEEGLCDGLKKMLSSPAMRADYEKRAAEGSMQFDLKLSINQITSLLAADDNIVTTEPLQENRWDLSSVEVSFIVPVYNVESYLEKCLLSLLDQDIPQSCYEIIVVNDGSTDGSVDIVNRFCSQHPSIIVINQENKGLSEARNAGLKVAKGKYIWFVDSDDRIEKNILKQLVDTCIAWNLDMLDFRFNKVDEAGNLIKSKKYLPSFDLGQLVDGSSYLNNYTFESGVWHFIFSHDFIRKNNMRFVPNIYHEDEEFTARALFFANRIMVVETFAYYYLVRQNSIITTRDMKKREQRLQDLVFIVHSLDSLSGAFKMKAYCGRSQGLKKRTRMHSVEIIRRLIEDRHSIIFGLKIVKNLFFCKSDKRIIS